MSSAQHFLLQDGLLRHSVCWDTAVGTYALIRGWELSLWRRRNPGDATLDPLEFEDAALVWPRGHRYQDSDYKSYCLGTVFCPPRRLGPMVLVPQFWAKSELAEILRGSSILGPANLQREVLKLCELSEHTTTEDTARWLLFSGKVALYYAPLRRVAAPTRPPEEVPTPSNITHYILVKVVDPQGRPMPRRSCELKAPGDGWRRYETDANGELYIPQMKPGTCQVRVLKVHPDAVQLG